MNFAIIGGDSRSGYAAQRLAAAGHRVRCHNVPSRPDYTLQDALGRADAVLLPIPTKTLNISIDTLLPLIPAHACIFGGAIPPALQSALEAGGFSVTDLLEVEALAVENADLTAHAAAVLLQTALPHSLHGQHILISGAGRIGKLLGMLLTGLGAQVTMAARKSADRAWCRALGLRATDFSSLPACPIVVNTVPCRVLSRDFLAGLPEGSVLMELASAPGGFDREEAEALGHRVISAGGLPGKYLPESAGAIIAETMMELILDNG